MSYGPIEDESVQVEVYDLGLEWYLPQYCVWAPPPFEDSLPLHRNFSGVTIVDVDLFPIAHGKIPCL